MALEKQEPPPPPAAQGPPVPGGHGPVPQGRRPAPLLDGARLAGGLLRRSPGHGRSGQTRARRPRAMIERVAALDPGYGRGSLDAFYVGYYGSLPDYLGGDAAKAREHFAKAQAAAGRTDTSPLLSLATTVCVKEQNAAEFKRLLDEVLAFDPATSPPNRLVNILNQRKARWYLDHIDDFFIELEHP
ncbi:MAG: TRAP transporter TatT component family protein [Sphingobacterium sp.]|nr:TRAP transporter TatT component family protein [Sphingobacterium sp.]